MIHRVQWDRHISWISTRNKAKYKWAEIHSDSHKQRGLKHIRLIEMHNWSTLIAIGCIPFSLEDNKKQTLLNKLEVVIEVRGRIQTNNSLLIWGTWWIDVLSLIKTRLTTMIALIKTMKTSTQLKTYNLFRPIIRFLLTHKLKNRLFSPSNKVVNSYSQWIMILNVTQWAWIPCFRFRRLSTWLKL